MQTFGIEPNINFRNLDGILSESFNVRMFYVHSVVLVFEFMDPQGLKI